MEKLAVLGPEGTFSDDAAKRYLRRNQLEMELTYFHTIDDVIRAVGTECECGVVPVENTLDGYVQRTLDYLLEREIYAAEQITIPVQFSLAANIMAPEELRKLYVQFKANGQCREAIEQLHPEQICTTESNMDSYYEAEKGVSGEGAVIPAHMLESSKASFKIENITDAKNNFTRFLVIHPGEQKQFPKTGKVRTSLYVTPETDHPGLLFRILKSFNEHQINIASIISRPTRKNMGTYNFYMELTADAEELNKILSALEEVQGSYGAKLVGVYAEP